MTADIVPMVGIVVVNYFGGDRTLECLASLQRLTWPADRLAVVLVDNGSTPEFSNQVAATFPSVKVVRSPLNLGFGGGCNLGFGALRHCDHIALVNNDATPAPDWLDPLVATLSKRPDVGAATPKVLLDGQYVEVEVRSGLVRPGGGDPRRLGVQLCGARVGGVDVSASIQLRSGFWGWEEDPVSVGGAFAWSDGRGVALLAVPRGEDADEVTVEVAVAHALADVTAEITAGAATVSVPVSNRPVWVKVGTARPVRLINNVGIALQGDGSTIDRGYLEPDRGQYDVPAEVFGVSGAAVLLSRRFLDDVGVFDDKFFLYYEDVDLSWRGRLRGWTYWSAPSSMVHHEHSKSVGDRSPLVRHLADRNRLLMLTKVAPPDLALAAVRRAAADLGRAVGRDIVRRIVAGRRPVVEPAARQARVLMGYLRLLPHALRERRRIRPGANGASVRTWSAWALVRPTCAAGAGCAGAPSRSPRPRRRRARGS